VKLMWAIAPSFVPDFELCADLHQSALRSRSKLFGQPGTFGAPSRYLPLSFQIL
jgi:hypothetical protein